MRRVIEEAIGMRVMQGPVLGKRFDQIGPLQTMQQDMPTIIGAVEQFTRPVKVQSPAIASPFAEKLELTGLRMIPPDTLLKFNPANVGGHGTSLTAVEPTIRSPGQGIGNAVRVFHAKASEQDFRVTIRYVISILVGVKQQIGDIQHEHATMSEGQS